jgi:dimethylargininase
LSEHDYRTAITREVSGSLADCELTHLDRQPIDVDRARAQHRAYCDLLVALGLRVVVLPEAPDLPDSVFVEDTAVAFNEGAVMTLPGAASRRPEVVAVAETLARYRPLDYLAQGTLDGGDVLHVGRTLYVGQTPRTSVDGTEALRALVAPAGYSVVPVAVDGCLHLKSGCSYLGRGVVLANREWFDAGALDGVEILDVDAGEPWAANTLAVRDSVVMASGNPETARRVADRGFQVRAVDVSELQKAEAGVSCMSILLS